MILIIVMCVIASTYKSSGKVVKSDNELVRTSDWNTHIADYVNKREIVLSVDGKNIKLEKNKIYMDNNLNIMLPVNILTNAFSCASNLYDSKRLVLEKYNNKLEAVVGENQYMLDGDVIESSVALTEKNGQVYIPATLVENGLEYNLDWNIDNCVINYVNTSKADSILPYAYDYRKNGRATKVKNQGVYGTCWAFSALTSLETYLLPEEDVEFSVENMVLNNGHKMGMYDGGDFSMSIAYLTSWMGPVSEEEDKYGDFIVNKEAKVLKHVQEIQLIEPKNIEAIKKAVFLYGGVQSSLYTSLTDQYSSSIYYNKEEYTYCYVGTKKVNHEVIIIGWDDNFPKEKFNADIEGNGAFICQNSWGEEFGDNGVFYVSYYDSNIGMHNIVYTNVEETDNYDNIYQYDIQGWTGNMGYDDEKAYFANVYTARGNENLEAVSFYAVGKNTEYEIYYVENFVDRKSFGEREFLKSGKVSNTGYYTINLEKEIELKKGQKFAIVVKIKTPNEVYPIAVSYDREKINRDEEPEDGEGYISFSGKNWEYVETTKKCNICLKVFTNNGK